MGIPHFQIPRKACAARGPSVPARPESDGRDSLSPVTLARNGSDCPLGSSDGLRISAQQLVGLRRSHTHTEEAPLDGAPKYQFANRLTRTSAHPEQGRAFGWVAKPQRSTGDPRAGFGSRRCANPTPWPPDRRALRARSGDFALFYGRPARALALGPGRSYGPPPNSVRVCYAALCLHTRLCGLCPTRVSFGARRESSRATTVRAGASKPTEMGRGDLKWLFKNKVSIQLQVPLQLPCYNFIRITLHRFEESAILTYVLNDGSSPSTA